MSTEPVTRGRRTKLTKRKPAEVIEALQECRGFVFLAAERLQCSPTTVQKLIRSDPRIARALQNCRGRRHDLVESKLVSLCLAGDAQSIKFYLRTQCKDRGYVERQEVTGANGSSLAVPGGKDNPAIARIEALAGAFLKLASRVRPGADSSPTGTVDNPGSVDSDPPIMSGDVSPVPQFIPAPRSQPSND